MKPINFFSPHTTKKTLNHELLISFLMVLLIGIFETPQIMRLYTLKSTTKSFENTVSEKIEQELTENEAIIQKLQQKISVLTQIARDWCNSYTVVRQIFEHAHNLLTIQQLHIEKSNVKIIGMIDKDHCAKLGGLITALPMYKDLGFTTTAFDPASPYYSFTIATREAVDGMQTPSYAKDNNFALQQRIHDKNKTTSLT